VTEKTAPGIKNAKKTDQGILIFYISQRLADGHTNLALLLTAMLKYIVF